jgi:hypothetical protein
MNPALLTRLLALPVRLRPAAAATPPGRRSRRAARAAVAWSVAVFLGLTAAASVTMNVFAPQTRDPEYGRRIADLKNRIAENPGRPVVVMIGSSRTSMGFRPDAWEASRPHGPRPDPLLFNLSLVGSGPVMELMALRRMYADGVRPDAVVFEYWPPFLREDGPYFEPDRIDLSRLYTTDREIVRGYFEKPADTERKMLVNRLHPLYENRHRILAQVSPSFLPWDRRINVGWENMDGWGWLPGLDEHPPRPDRRAGRVEHCRPIYQGQFVGYAVHPVADRALRESVAVARANGARVAFAFLPESSEFRGWYPPAAERLARDHLTKLTAELGVPLVDARLWMPDEFLVDGFHLSRVGAAGFTRKFGPALAETFPDLGGR